MAKKECNWCHQEFEEEELRDVVFPFFSKTFWVCEKDFYLLWQLFAGAGEAVKHLKSVMTASKR